jgi:tRNA dimethylallyltransferase
VTVGSALFDMGHLLQIMGLLDWRGKCRKTRAGTTGGIGYFLKEGAIMAQLAAISRERPVLIAGPTASGKSALAMALAARDGRVVVNADALQVYARWQVLTARPDAADMARLPHALYGHVAGDAAYSVGHWLRELAPLLDRPIVIVGGTGLYLTALTSGFATIPDIPETVRMAGDALRQADMAAMIAALDPGTRARLDLANPMRVQRAWEVQEATGRGLASWQDATGAALLPLQQVTPLVFRPDPAVLNARIDQRFDAMIAAGALDEARAALPGWNPALPSSRAIGAAELVAHLRGEMPLSAAIAAAKTATHQYAKRQRTWFRNRMAHWQEFA